MWKLCVGVRAWWGEWVSGREGREKRWLRCASSYLKKIMTKLMLLCFWQHINIIMRSILGARSSHPAEGSSLAPYILPARMITIYVYRLWKVLDTLWSQRHLLINWWEQKEERKMYRELSVYLCVHLCDCACCVCMWKYFNLKFPHQTCPSANPKISPGFLQTQMQQKQKLSFD